MEEEAAAMEKFRSGASASNPFAAAPAGEKSEETPNILDLFGVASPAQAQPAVSQQAPAQTQAATSDDLLQLTGNPFANMLNGENHTVTRTEVACQPDLVKCWRIVITVFFLAAAPQSSAAMFQNTPAAPGE